MHAHQNHKAFFFSPLDTGTGKDPLMQDKGNSRASTDTVAYIEELEKVAEELRQARRAALNLMEDAILSKEALRQSEEKYRTKLEQDVRDRTTELNASRNLLQATIDSSLDVIQVFEAVRDKTGTIVDFTWIVNNRKAIEQNGDVIGKGLLTRNQGVVASGIFRKMVQVTETGVPQESEQYYNYEQFNGWFYQALVKSGDGVVMTTRDITEQKKTQQQIKESRELLQATMDASMDMIQVFEAIRNGQREIVDFKWILNNHAAEKIYGNVIGKSLLQNNPGIVAEGIFDTFKKVVETGVPDQSERHYVHEQFNGWFYQSTVKLGDGVATTTTDITERKTAEQEILRLKDEIAQQATDRYYTLFNSIDEGFSLLDIQFDENGKAYDVIIRDANPAQERIDGTRAFIGKRVREIMPDIEQKWIERYAAVAKTGEPANFEDWSESNQRWYKVSASRVGAEGSTLVAIVYDDITERKLQEQRQAFLLKLNDALRFLSDPLEIQKAATELLGDHFDTARSYVMEIDEANHLATMRAETLRANVPSNIGVYDLRLFEKVISPLRSGKPLAIKNWDDSVKEEMKIGGNGKEVMTERQVVSQISVPIIKDGGLIATLTVLDNRPRNWTEHDVTLMFETAERTWAAVVRAKAEEALRESESRLHSIANLVPDLLWDSEPNGTTNWYNQRWLEYTGQSFEEAIGWGWVDAIHPDDREGSAKRYREAVEGGKPLRQEHRIRRYDGEYHWFVVNAFPLKDETGRVVKIYGAATDMQDQRVLLQTVQQSEERLRTLADAVPQVIWANDAEGKANYFNQRWYDYTGLSREKSIGPGWQAVVHPGDAPASIDKWNKALAAGEIFDTEYRLRRYDGAYRWFIGRNVPLKDLSGNVTGWFGSATDIHDLKETQEALSQSEARLRVTMESVLDYAIITMDTERKIQRWSKGAEQLFGYTEGEVIGQSADLIFTAEDKEARVPENEMETAKTTGRAVDERWHRHKDGSRLFVSGVMAPIYDGSLTGYVKVARDITQQQLFTEELHRLVAERTVELQRSNEDLRQFAHVASHDLKEPVRKIQTFNNRILDEYADALPPKVKTFSEKIGSAADRMIQMIEGVLRYSKLGNAEQVWEQVDLNETIRQIESDLEVLIQQRKAVITTTELPTLTANATLLYQLFYNLILNALKFAKAGEPPRVRISAERVDLQQGVFAKIAVADNGIGFEQEFSQEIFKTFTRLHPAEDYEGTGLGLALCKKIVERHGGTISASGDPDKGAVFTILLPL